MPTAIASGDDVTGLMGAAPKSGDDVTALMSRTAPPATAPTFWQRHPTLATAAEGTLNALPAVGGMAAGAVAAPEVGPAALAAVPLGVAAGRGLRDLIAEHIGLEQPTDVVTRTARMALDGAVAAATPGIIEALKSPTMTLGDFTTYLRKIPILKVGIPDLSNLSEVAKNIPVSVLSKPAWQSALPSDLPTADATRLRTETVPALQSIIQGALKDVQGSDTANALARVRANAPQGIAGSLRPTPIAGTTTAPAVAQSATTPAGFTSYAPDKWGATAIFRNGMNPYQAVVPK